MRTPFDAEFLPLRVLREQRTGRQSRIKRFRKSDSHRVWSDRSLPSLPALLAVERVRWMKPVVGRFVQGLLFGTERVRLSHSGVFRFGEYNRSFSLHL